MSGDFARWLATETAASLRFDTGRDPFDRIPNPDEDYAGTPLELRAPAPSAPVTEEG